MKDTGCTSDMYPIREPRKKIELWKNHARQKHDMTLAGLIRWLINLDMNGDLQKQGGNGNHIQDEELILSGERVKELEREIELRDNEITSMNLSRDVRLIIFQALNLSNEVKKLFTDQIGFSGGLEKIARFLGIPESSGVDRRALEFVLMYLVSTEFLGFKGGKYFVIG